MFSNLKVGNQLPSGFGVLLVIMAVMSAVGMWRLEGFNSLTRGIVEDDIAAERIVAELRMGTNANRERVLVGAQIAEPLLQKSIAAQIDATSKQISELPKSAEMVVRDEQAKFLLDEVAAEHKTYIDTRQAVKLVRDEGKAAASVEVRQSEDGSLTPAIRDYALSQQQFADHISKRSMAGNVFAEAKFLAALIWHLSIAALAVLFGTLLCWYLTRSLTLLLSQALRVSQSTARGAIGSEIKVIGKDEASQSLRGTMALVEKVKSFVTTVDKLTEVVGQLRDATESINTAAKEIASGNTVLSSRTEGQVSSLVARVSSAEELTSTGRQNAEKASQAKQLAFGASDGVFRVGAVVSQVGTTTSSINESDKKRVDIISVIDGTAFQTNILALNAEVEAARAGEQGRGYAVGTTEVRNLAQRSATAAKENKEFISDSVETVGTGTKLVNETGKTMEEIVSSVKRVTDIKGEIMAASHKQSTGIEQVKQAITPMDGVTQQNAALVEQAGPAESREEQAQLLAQSVEVFRVEGNSSHTDAKKRVVAQAGRLAQSVIVRAVQPIRTMPQKRRSKTHRRGAPATRAGMSSRRCV